MDEEENSMKYFSILLSANHPGNQLQKDVLELLTSKSQLLIEDRSEFINEMGRQVAELNAKHSRCKPLNFSTYKGTESTGLYLGGNYTVGFHIYPVKNTNEESA
jgi:hypothetical protein